jgi:hypothetical protein
MALVAYAAPILPSKIDQWRQFIAELNGPRRREFEASRQRAGVHERTFLQHSPQGVVVIATFEGEDPAGALGHMATSDDEFTRWFLQQVADIHGVDPTQLLPALPELVIDSQAS